MSISVSVDPRSAIVPMPSDVQYIYLDFDGELTQYCNDDLNLRVDIVEVEDSRLNSERIAAITAALNDRFVDRGVLFVTERPRDVGYSTVYIGRTVAFDKYGDFTGIAETVDKGNLDRSDNAFVNLDASFDDAAIIDTVAHEAEHLLGTLDHGGNGLEKYARTVYSCTGAVSLTPGINSSYPKEDRESTYDVVFYQQQNEQNRIDEFSVTPNFTQAAAMPLSVKFSFQFDVTKYYQYVDQNINSSKQYTVYYKIYRTYNGKRTSYYSSSFKLTFSVFDRIFDQAQAGKNACVVAATVNALRMLGKDVDYDELEDHYGDLVGDCGEGLGLFQVLTDGGLMAGVDFYWIDCSAITYERLKEALDKGYAVIMRYDNSDGNIGHAISVDSVYKSNNETIIKYTDSGDGEEKYKYAKLNGDKLYLDGKYSDGTFSGGIEKGGVGAAVVKDATNWNKDKLKNNQIITDAVRKSDVQGATLAPGGSLSINGSIAGSNTIYGGRLNAETGISVAEGTGINVYLAYESPEQTPVIGNLDNLSGAAVSVKVQADQAAGPYRLAANAANFSGTISIDASDICGGEGDSVGRYHTVFDTSHLGDMKYGDEIQCGITTYSLSLDADDTLLLTVSYMIPEVLSVNADIDHITNSSVSVTATFSDTTETAQYSLDGENWETYAASVVMKSNGTVYFRGIDAMGNISDVTSYTVSNIDSVAPVKPTANADITEPTNGNVTVTATFSADTVTEQYSLDGETWSAYEDGVVIAENGAVYFRGIDAAGNASEVVEYTVSNIDKVAPAKPTIEADVTAPTNRDVYVTVTYSEDSAVWQYSMDNETWETCLGVLIFHGNATAYVRGIDEAGNISDVTTVIVSNIDKVAPDAPTIKASTTTLTNQNVTVTAAFSEDSAKKQYSTDKKTWKTYSAALSVGKNATYYFRGIDEAGNISDVTTYKVSNIDKVAPTVKLSTTAPTNKNVTVTATFTKDAAKKQYSTDKKTWQSYSKALSVAKNGTYYFRGVDKNGKASTVVTLKVTNIDKTAPTVPKLKASTTKATNQNVTITATFSSDSAKKQYSADNKTWKTCSKALTATKNGTYYFRGVDAAGNVSKVASIKVANIDKTAPAAPTLKLNTANAAKSVTVTATFSKDSAKKQYSTDNKTWKTYSKALSVKANGTYYFRGVDAAGNVSKVKSVKVANVVDTANNNWAGATVLKKTVLGALDAKADKVDYYDVADVARLMLDMEKGKAKVSFYDSNKKSVKVSALTMANGTVRKNVSSLTLTTNNGTTDNFTVAALDDAVKYLKIETADKTLDSYKLAKLA